MYCSQECKEFADKNFHNYECKIIGVLLKAGVMQMTLRVFFQALNIFDGSIDKLEAFLSEYEHSNASVYDFDFSNDNDEQTKAKSSLISMFCLARNNRASNDHLPAEIFVLHPSVEIRKIWQTHSVFINKLFSRILQIYDSNFHGICGWSRKMIDINTPQMIGVGCYVFGSLINHSCVPNVNRSYICDKMIIIVDRPIKKGEQIFDCYK